MSARAWTRERTREERRMQLSELEPGFSSDAGADTSEDGAVPIWDAEGEFVLSCRPEDEAILVAALEYAHRALQEAHGCCTDEVALGFFREGRRG